MNTNLSGPIRKNPPTGGFPEAQVKNGSEVQPDTREEIGHVIIAEPAYAGSKRELLVQGID
jgi:hypothetical protein